MKILKTTGFVSERIQVQPITNAELEKVQKEIEDIKNPFGLTKDDLKGALENVPMGIVVRMMEEMKLQKYETDVSRLQLSPIAGFIWIATEAGDAFWQSVVQGNYDLFFEKYPEYRKYNLN